jgi:DNA-binding response OmpR family regulator
MHLTPKVLVVDDNHEDIELVRSILKPAGYEVSGADDTRVGLDLASQKRFDVVLLDNRFIHSPVVGIAMVSAFAAKVPGGVVMVTAFGDEELEKDAKMLGASAYLPKPLDSDKLLKTVAELVAKHPPASS